MNEDHDQLLLILGELRGDMKSVVKNQEDFKSELTYVERRLSGQSAPIEERLSALEAFRSKIAGFAIAASLVASVITTKIAHLLGLTQ